MKNTIFIDPLSTCSLYVEPYFNDTKLSTASAFVLFYKESYFLITNWHVVSGRDADTEKCLDKNSAIPNKLLVYFYQKNKLNTWIEQEIPLLDTEENPMWIEHPHKNKVDVIALPIHMNNNISIYPIDLSLKDIDILPQPGMPISILGFPFGLSAGGKFPIWKTGHLASDHDVDYDENKPAFLIDATTKSGMSGSPVFMRTDSMYKTSNGDYVFKDGITTRFLGIYAGRIHEESDIGRVWRPFLITEIMEQKLLFTEESRRIKPSSRNSTCPCGKSVKFKDCCGIMS